LGSSGSNSFEGEVDDDPAKLSTVFDLSGEGQNGGATRLHRRRFSGTWLAWNRERESRQRERIMDKGERVLVLIRPEGISGGANHCGLRSTLGVAPPSCFGQR
jgi:phage baseplate assembly protein gpV